MRSRWPVGMVLLGVVWLGIAGCDAGGAPPSGSRAVVAADYLEKQRIKIEEFRSSLKSRPQPKIKIRR